MDPRDRNLGYFNLLAAEQHGERVAIIDMSRSPAAEITHANLNDRMDRAGAALQNAGLRPGARVLLAMENRFEFIECFFGAMRAGFVPIPLNHKLGADTIRFIMSDSETTAAIVDPNCHSQIVSIVNEATLASKVATDPVPGGWQNYEDWISGTDPATLTQVEISCGQTAFLPYTSGSTGVPKGVLLPHDGMLWGIRAAQQYWPAEPEDRALIAGPLFHKNAMRVSVKPKLRVGGSVVIFPRFEPKMFLTALAQYRCTHTGGVPAMYRMILAEEEVLSSLEFPALKSLEMGSAVVGADLIAAVEKAFSVSVIEAYGLTEGGGPLREPVDGSESPLGSCGLVAPEVEVKLVGENGDEDESEGESDWSGDSEASASAGTHDATHEMRSFVVEDTLMPMTRGSLKEVVLNATSRWYVETLRLAKSGDTNAAALTAQMLRAGYGCHADSEEATYWQRVARSAGARRIEGVYDELP